MRNSIHHLRLAAMLLVASATTASAAVADAFIDVPAPATLLLVGAAVGGAMVIKAFRDRR